MRDFFVRESVRFGHRISAKNQDGLFQWQFSATSSIVHMDWHGLFQGKHDLDFFM
jgi:hypothetical protein